ncbi:MAG: M15 family metallopeptidase [Flavobacteriales bacterium]|nr:M15 family metallopeptidase [Flavobacteriales bacterium]
MRQLPVFLFLLFPFSVFAQSSDTAKFVLGKVEYAQHSEFVKIPQAYANKEGMYLRKEALDAFILMRKKAQTDGVNLTIISACRNFNHQKSIWEAKWNGSRKVGGKDLSQSIPNAAERAKEILKYSSMPGTSRHHWGTDIDVNSLSSAYFESGKGKKEYEWLRDNALEFGFCQVYSEKGNERKHGYEEEKWHWSYVPLSSRYLAYYKRNIKQTDIQGFDGADALPFSEIRKYVLGISTDCK